MCFTTGVFCFDGLVIRGKSCFCAETVILLKCVALLKLARDMQIGTISPNLHLHWLTAGKPALSAVSGRVGQVPAGVCMRRDACAEMLDKTNPCSNCTQDIPKEIHIQ